MSASSRPTGYRRSRLGTSETTVGRPCGSLAVLTYAGRLVQRVDDVPALERGGLAVDGDGVAVLHVARGIAHDLAADRHPAGEDELLGGAARGDAGVGQVLGEPHGRLTLRGAAKLPRQSEPGSRCHHRGRGPRASRRDAGRARPAPLPRPPGLALDGDRRPGYDAMTDLPAPLRDELAARVPFSTLEPADEAHARDGTVKALFRTADGRPVEAVLMRYRDGRRSVCVSSQSGCPLTCTFCATGTMRFGRNLNASEILDQVLHFRRIEPVDHLVFMGMGEPGFNMGSVLEAAEAAAGCRHHPSQDHRLHRRLAARHRAADRERHAAPPRVLAARPGRRPALADHARQRALPARRRARGVPRLLRPPPAPRLHRVRDARRRQRLLRPGRRSSRSCSTRASSRST